VVGVILLRAVLALGGLIWIAWWVTVLVGRWEADPLAVVVGLAIFSGWLLVHRRVRRS
jgi:hypothetical protein